MKGTNHVTRNERPCGFWAGAFGDRGAQVIRVRGLKKAFDGNLVLAGIDIDILDAENLVLLGNSGSGKSVFMKCMLGLIEPDAGSIQIDGYETVGLKRTARLALMEQFGVLFQNGALFDSLSVWRNVAFSFVHHAKADQARGLAVSALAKVGLGEDVADLYPADLSGGMQKRVALARALIRDPKFIFLDTPTAGLDPILTAIIDSFIFTSLKRISATALTITYEVESAFRLAQRAAFLGDGRILWQGPISDILTAEEQQVADFVKHWGQRSTSYSASRHESSNPDEHKEAS